MLDGSQVAEILSMHPFTVRKWVAAGKIPYVRLGGRVKFDPGALAAWFDKRTLG
jgi:excisionase family DNA binding protein